MPIYEYACAECGHGFERFHLTRSGPTPLDTAECPNCAKTAKRVMSKTAFALKGGGWAADGYASTPNGKGPNK